MTPNGTAIRAIRAVRRMSLRELARLTRLDRGHLSRLERGLTGASEASLHRIATVLQVPFDDLVRGDDEPATDQPPAREVPAPGTPEGELFHYTPEEAARWLPWSAAWLRRRARLREVPHNRGGGLITFTGRDIGEISAMTAIRPEHAEPPDRSPE
ncbi:helix-turn-helix transcriptional regulator [Streptomyces sp. DSM 44915]|uniref:Helix-turn-helix transcriptional regulator n=1 Tax=Streptomyces chisholmiae TaxID=3075540 RepID=A0ABU2JYB0_9ACTN|nr:helix-turn-helix transcriptional regulator [Streptomyces sp. DSM 44915]MDT0269980.1 helix-turn-helix transcriptional regulator [Streptomyces sp. DSM 44915]